MKADNPLDRHLKVNNGIDSALRNAVTQVVDVLDLAWMATQSVFEERATPELALLVYDRLVVEQQRQSSLSAAEHVQE